MCPRPWIWSRCIDDGSQYVFLQTFGALLIISRYPIVDSDFHIFDYPACLADAFAKKGLLYAKIDLSSIGGSHLHMFNTHLQSTENDLIPELHVQSYVTRYEQIKDVR